MPNRRRFPLKAYFAVLALLLIIAVAPIVSVVTANAIASTHSCTVDEGSVHPCLINGTDWGETLYAMGVLGWLMLLTLPGGAIACVVWLILLLWHRHIWKKRNAGAAAVP